MHRIFADGIAVGILSAVFQWGGISGPPAQAPEVPAQNFHPRFLVKSFSRFSLEGFRNFAPKVSPEIFGGPEIPALGLEVPAQEIFG